MDKKKWLALYVEDDCLFPPKVWTQGPSEKPRYLYLNICFEIPKANGLESFHRPFNAQFHIIHTLLFI
ncbi:Integrase H2C2 domain-containing protein [Aphis craccivora]|uniref:Integrase H2C2 domain-containing protein n=1 Tax=Aphis craccivora TaxID=307492 RepID=A0A6G0Y6X7_APHCR|nr:Integrase H2C2 domain-containing protein [Aphis craccivora]